MNKGMLFTAVVAVLCLGCGSDEGVMTPPVPGVSVTTVGPGIGPGLDLRPREAEGTNDAPGRVGVSYQLWNQGADHSGSGWTSVLYEVDGPFSEEYHDWIQIPQGGNWSNISFDCYAGVPGTYEITVVLDFREEIEEINENNNVGTTGPFEVE